MNSTRFLNHNNIEQEKIRNDKLYGRNVPSFFLQPNFDFRPVSTKYSFFQIKDEYAKSNEKINVVNDYNPKNVFYPGDSKPPFSYFARNIDTETNLRNQNMALQKCDQAVYVPNSSSDLYNSMSHVSSSTREEPLFYKLSDKEKFESYPKISNLKTKELFHNNTRLSNYHTKNDTRNKNKF